MTLLERLKAVEAIAEKAKTPLHSESDHIAIHDPDVVRAFVKVARAAQAVSESVERVGLGEQGAIGALYLTGNALRADLRDLDAILAGKGVKP